MVIKFAVVATLGALIFAVLLNATSISITETFAFRFGSTAIFAGSW